MAGHPSRMVPVTPNTGAKICKEYFQAREIYQQKKKIVEQLLLGGVTPIPEAKDEGLPDLLGNLDSDDSDSDYEQEEEPSGKRPINSTFQIPKPSTTMQTRSQSVAGTQEGPSTSGTSKSKGIMKVTFGDDTQNTTVESDDEDDGARCYTRPEEKLRRIYLAGHFGHITAFDVLSESEAWIRSKLSIKMRGSKYYNCPHPNCRRSFISWYELFLHYQPQHLALQDCKRVLPLRCRGSKCAEAFCDPVDVLKHGQDKHPRSPWVKELADMLKRGRIME